MIVLRNQVVPRILLNYDFSRFSQSFSPMVKKKPFPDGIGPVIRIALFGVGRAGKDLIIL